MHLIAIINAHPKCKSPRFLLQKKILFGDELWILSCGRQLCKYERHTTPNRRWVTDFEIQMCYYTSSIKNEKLKQH